jgi:hypothetical protein
MFIQAPERSNVSLYRAIYPDDPIPFPALIDKEVQSGTGGFLASDAATGTHRAVYFDGPQSDRGPNGEEIPAWVVYVGDDEAEPVSTVHTLHHFKSAELLAYRMAEDRRLDLIQEATPADSANSKRKTKNSKLKGDTMLEEPIAQGHADDCRYGSDFSESNYASTRAQAVAYGVQVDVSKTAQEAEIKFPMFLTRAVYDAYVSGPPDDTGQDEAGRLWDVVRMTRFAILRSHGHTDRLPVGLYVKCDDNQPARLVKLVATCGPLDRDDPSPAITVMLPDED